VVDDQSLPHDMSYNHCVKTITLFCLVPMLLQILLFVRKRKEFSHLSFPVSAMKARISRDGQMSAETYQNWARSIANHPSLLYSEVQPRLIF
jgi:hypothetical protein